MIIFIVLVVLTYLAFQFGAAWKEIVMESQIVENDDDNDDYDSFGDWE